MASNGFQLVIGAGAVMLLALSGQRSRERGVVPGDVPDEPRDPTNPGSKLMHAWGEFISKQEEQSGLTDIETVEWDQLIERGVFPPGYFFDLFGKLVSPDQVLPYRMLIGDDDPMTFEEAVEESMRCYAEQTRRQSVFYVNRLMVAKTNPVPSLREEVRFDPSARVRLMPTTAEDLQGIQGSPNGSFQFLVPRWNVELLERRSEVLSSDRYDLNYGAVFEPFQFMLR
jgi:hypothetical protein